MRREKFVAGLLALSLMFSGLPMASVQAAELPAPAEVLEQEAEGDVSAEQETESSAPEKQETEGDVSAEQENEAVSENSIEPEADEIRVDEKAKMAGSNGVFYDGVTYLSARNVLALDPETQKVYRSLCDDIAANKEGGLEMQNVVIAVNAQGDLICSYYVPMRTLETIQAEFLPEAEGALTPASAEAAAEDKKDGETSEDQKDDETAEDKKDNETSEDQKNDETTEDKKDDETSEDQKDDETTEDKKDDETSEDQKDDETTEDKKDDETSEDQKDDEATEDKKDDEASEDQKDDEATEDKKDDETSEDQKDDEATEDKKDDETSEDQKDEEDLGEESEEETYVLTEENMDKIVEPEEETFEVIESVRVANTIDLGYGGASDEMSRDGRQFHAILPKDNYFVSQLNSAQKKYYNAAKEKLINGSNSFSFQDSLSVKNSVTDNVAHAVSALILAYPDKTDWIAKPGGFSGKLLYSKGKATYTFTFDKSDYYTGNLDSEAGVKVQQVGAAAQQYAAVNYPDAPVYGIVKYFDQWVCENGYYEMIGVDGPEGEEYYNCHSAYGILLKGYGVCESYAKTMSRLLDGIGIPNIYVVGMAGEPGNMGGHAWNYIQMPDGKWYLQDSTWNDTTDIAHTTSNGQYLLVREDGMHEESGCNYVGETPDFTFPVRSDSSYQYKEFGLSESECNLVVKETKKLTGAYDVPGTWTSSNAKVAKVDKNGKVTAVAGGTAEITFAGEGVTGKCIVNVDQIKSVKVKETKKTSEKVSLGIEDTQKDSRDIVLEVDMGTSPHTAEWMISNGTEAPTVAYSKPGIATVTPAVAGNEIMVKVQAEKEGSTAATVKFGGKTVKINVSAGKLIMKEMFDVTWPDTMSGEEDSRMISYTGKAIKPAVKKKTDDAYKSVKFKTTYVNNKDAGTAKIVITGTGQYGGTIEYPFEITPLSIEEAAFSQSIIKSKTYNGGSNPPAITVKLNKKTLKANKDYEILYNGKSFEDMGTTTLPVGTYSITIKGIGNYTGEVKKIPSNYNYVVTANTLDKVKIAGSGSMKHTGIPKNPFTVKIGNNILPAEDYNIVWYIGQGKTKSDQAMTTAPFAKGKYTAVITVSDNGNLTTGKKQSLTKTLTIK